MRRQLKPTRSVKNAFRPQCEVLEDRNLLAVSAILTATTLTIEGTPDRDVVSIVDQGNTPAMVGVTPQVFVFSNGALIAQGSSVNLTTISFSMKGGNDVVNYSLGNFSKGSTGSLTRYIVGFMGAGDDVFHDSLENVGDLAALTFYIGGGGGDDTLETTYALGGSFPVATSANITLNGAGGDDVLSAVATGDLGAGAFIEQKDTITVTLTGGDGDDQLGTFGFLDLDGILNVTMDAGNGDDTIVGRFTITAGSGSTGGVPNSTKGQLNVTELGGSGNDDLTLVINNQSTNVIVTTTVDGGSGKDTVNTVGSNVTITPINVP